MALADVVVVLLCIAGAGGSTGARRCKGLLQTLLSTGAFPFAAVVQVLSYDRQHEVTRFVPIDAFRTCSI